MLNVIDSGGQRPLTYRNYSPFSIPGMKPIVRPDDRDDVDVDMGMDVF